MFPLCETSKFSQNASSTFKEGRRGDTSEVKMTGKGGRNDEEEEDGWMSDRETERGTVKEKESNNRG